MPRKEKKAKNSLKSVKPAGPVGRSKAHKVEEETGGLDGPYGPSTEVEPQIIERIVYRKKGIHGFFRTLMILVLLLIGFLMLGESMNIAKITIGKFALDTIYPIIIILSTIILRSYRRVLGKLFGLILFLFVFIGFFSIKIYFGLNPQAPAKFGEQIAFEITGNRAENATIQTLATNIDIEGNTKSPYFQGTRTSDRNMLTSTTTSGNQQTFFIQDNNTLNLLQNFVSNLTLYVPTQTTFQNIYIRNARGTENINTQDMNRQKMTLNGGINKIVLDINNVSPKAVIEIQGAIQDITINVPKNVGIQMKYKNRIGYKTIPNMNYQSGYVYTSSNITQAKTILTLNVSTFIGRLKINWK